MSFAKRSYRASALEESPALRSADGAAAAGARRPTPARGRAARHRRTHRRAVLLRVPWSCVSSAQCSAGGHAKGVSASVDKEDTVPSASKMSTPVAVDVDVIEGRYADLGGYTVGFESFKQDVDPAPYFVGLPEDRCGCAHWGVVTAGQLTFRWADREETFVAGDAYYAPPGHLPLISAGTSVIEFSPSSDLATTMAVVEKNMHANEVQA